MEVGTIKIESVAKKLSTKVLVIGSGPIVIVGGRVDYAGTQVCRALKEEGVSRTH